MTDGLIDPHGRRIEYVRLSVTDRCDLRCFYCLPKGFKEFRPPREWLTAEETVRVMAAFAALGTRRIRVTGGEPLVRRDIVPLVRALAAIPGIDDLSLSTNATQLERHADGLREAGIQRINVSLDTLDPARFREITRGELAPVIRGLERAAAVGLQPVKINMVVMKGINDHEVFDMVEFCRDHGFTLRFIEAMPVGDGGRRAGDHFVDLDEVRRRLAERFELIPDLFPGGGPARYVRLGASELRIGFITPLSRHFCDTCNRVRLAVDGTLFMCLGQDHQYPLRPLLRAGASDEALHAAILEAIALKPQKHEFQEKPDRILRYMSLTGG
ncbi:GTP 3',8-cyclase MoaA [Endothiovibrio diazotrophicus]